MDKSLALWRMDAPASGEGICSASQAELVARVTAAGGPVFSLATPRDTYSGARQGQGCVVRDSSSSSSSNRSRCQLEAFGRNGIILCLAG